MSGKNANQPIGSVVVELRGSPIGAKPKTRATLRALGLRRIGDQRKHVLRPEIRGMLLKVNHLVEVNSVPASATVHRAAPSLRSGGPREYSVGETSGELIVVPGGLARVEKRADGPAVGWQPKVGVRDCLLHLHASGRPGDRVVFIKSGEVVKTDWNKAIPAALLQSNRKISLLRLDSGSHSVVWERFGPEDQNGEFVALIDGADWKRYDRLVSDTSGSEVFARLSAALARVT